MTAERENWEKTYLTDRIFFELFNEPILTGIYHICFTIWRNLTFIIVFLAFGTVSVICAPKFNFNDQVQANADCNVRSSASTGNNILYLQGIGSIGTVKGGPITSSGFNWYYITWGNNPTSGWSADTFLNLSPPETISPGNASIPGTTLNTLTPQFTWFPVNGATGYGLYIRDTNSNTLVFPNADGNTTTPLIGTSYILPSGILFPGHHYIWNLTSFSGTTEYVPPPGGSLSRWFNTGNTPEPPSFAEAEWIDNYVVVAWADNSTSEDDFSIERKSNAGGSYSQIADVPANTTWFTNDTDLAQNVVYYYRIRAHNSLGYSDYGNETYAALPSLPNPPSNLQASSTANGILLNWQDNSTSEGGFSIQRRQGSTFDYISVGANTTSYLDTSVSQSITYCYTITATNAFGNSAQTSEECETYSLSPPPVAIIAGDLTPVTGSSTYYGKYSTGSVPLQFSWLTSDGQISNDPNPQFQFNSPGIRTIALTVTDSAQQTSHASILINVQASNSGNTTFFVAIGADPVVLATGNYIQNHVDFQIPGKGFPFEFKRFYNSKFSDQTGVPLGFGWTFNYNERLVDNGTNVLIVQGDGSTWTFFSTNNGYIGEPGICDSLGRNADNTWSLTNKSQTVTLFNTNGQLLSITDKNANSITCVYSGGILNQIIDTAGRTNSFGTNELGCISLITDSLGRSIQFIYDPQTTNLIAVVDANGGTNQYFYDGNHQMTNACDAKGTCYIYNEYDQTNYTVVRQHDAFTNWTYFAYDFTNRITYVTNAFGKVSTHCFDENLLETKAVDESGNETIFAYDQNRNRTFVKDKNGNQTQYGYDSLGNATNKIDALTNITAIQYDALNNPIKRIDALTNVTTFGYDSRGNLTSTTNALNLFNLVQYDSSGLPVVLINARGFGITNQYDQNGNLTNLIDSYGFATRFTYDGVGRKVLQIDSLNYTSSFAYDNDNNLLFTTNALNFVSSFTYDANNNPITSQNARNAVITNVFDLKDRLIAVLAPLGQTNGTIYDALDRKIATYDALGNQTTYAYDDIGNLIAVTNALNQLTRFTYDAQGNQTSVINPTGHYVTNFFDALNRKIATIEVSISTNLTAYDALGHVRATTNANGQVTQFFYDPIGRLTNVIDPASQSVYFVYDQNGNRTQTVDPNHHSWTNVFNKLNQLIEQDDPLGHAMFLNYDPVGNLTNKITANGDNINYRFDGLNRLVNIAYPNGPPVTFAYDSVGNRTNMLDSIGPTSWQYDLLNRLVNITDPYGQSVTNDYNPNGNRVSLIYPGNKIVNYGFDALNRMTSLTNWLNGVVIYNYDSRGNLITVTNANATTARFGYDVADRLVGLTNTAPDSSVIAAYRLTLDGLGNHTQATHNQPLFPILSNQTNNYIYDSDNRLAAIDSQTVTHNWNGDLTSIGTNLYAYDFEDRLVQLSLTNTFTYDGLGNRVARMVNGQVSHFVLDRTGALTQVLMEDDENNSPIAYYIFGRGLTQRISASGEVATYHFNIQGSTVAITDSEGNVTDSYAYDSFGGLANIEGDSPQPFRYLGRYGIVDDGSGLLYARARYFSPQLGRFLTKDPIMGRDGDSQSLNRYVYALNDPLLFIDPSGLSAHEGSSESAADAAYWDAFDRSFYSSWGYKILVVGKYAGDVAQIGLAILSDGGSLVANQVADTSVWKLAPVIRGSTIERSLGANLPKNFPVIDKAFDGTVTSIKSINLNAATYQNSASLLSKINKYVDSLAGFNGETWAGVTIKGSEIVGKELELAIPSGNVSMAQQAVIDAATLRARNMGINIITTPFP